MKYWIYHMWLRMQRLLWRIRGFRKLTAFGCNLKVTASTVFPSYRKLRLPRGGYLSDIVRYGDFVQFHAICSRIDQMRELPVIVEVGAHHGAYAVVMGNLVKERGGKVLAIEPNPVSYEILKNNVKLNGLTDTVICVGAAVTEKAGTVSISLDDSQSSINNDPGKSESVTVQGLPLATIIGNSGITSVSLLLVDVEGAELAVLKSFPWDSVPVQTIYCELHPYAWAQFGHSGRDVQEFLLGKGYRCFDMYLREYTAFKEERYIGPCLFLPNQG